MFKCYKSLQHAVQVMEVMGQHVQLAQETNINPM